MSTTSFTITHDFQPAVTFTKQLVLPFSPFYSGEWTLFSNKPSSSRQFAFELRWTGAVVPARLRSLSMRIVNRAPGVAERELLKVDLFAEPAGFPSRPASVLSTPFMVYGSVYQAHRVAYAQLQLIVTLDDQPEPSTKAMASWVAAHLASRHPNDVRLYFPRCERELWAIGQLGFPLGEVTLLQGSLRL